MVGDSAEEEAAQKKSNRELCEALIGSDIPLFKLANEIFASFLAKYTTVHIPDESTLRRGYVKPAYTLKLEEIQTI